jgi:hypothetical protein
MLVSKETRSIQLTAPDLAQVAGLENPEQFQFEDGSQTFTADIERNV